MSTVPETYRANHMGIGVLGFPASPITRGVIAQKLDHKEVLEVVGADEGTLIDLLRRIIPGLT